MDFWKWFYPGLKIKRWLAVTIAGTICIGAGLAVINDSQFLGLFESAAKYLTYNLIGRSSSVVSGLITIAIGIFLVGFGFRRMIQSLMEALLPANEPQLVQVLFQKRHLERGPRIVVLGGGTGLSTMLRGLKQYTSNITAIVTVADDGGSSGRLRGELGILAPGDIRNCLVALADTETSMDELFRYRFRQGEGLTGHSLGNLLLAAMTDIAGGFVEAIQEVSRVLAVRGRVLPVTLTDVNLGALLDDNTVIRGQSSISRSSRRIRRVFLEPGDCEPVPEALQAIRDAEAIILGPGSLYTSVIPCLLVKGVPEAIRQSRAVKIYVCNVMTQPGETTGYSASDHLQAIYDHAGPDLVDSILVNNQVVPKLLLRKYREQGAYPVTIDTKQINRLGVLLVKEKLIDEKELVRHHPEKLARAVLSLLLRRKNRPERFNLAVRNLFSERPNVLGK